MDPDNPPPVCPVLCFFPHVLAPPPLSNPICFVIPLCQASNRHLDLYLYDLDSRLTTTETEMSDPSTSMTADQTQAQAQASGTSTPDGSAPATVLPTPDPITGRFDPNDPTVKALAEAALNPDKSKIPRPYKCPLCDRAFYRLEHQVGPLKLFLRRVRAC